MQQLTWEFLRELLELGPAQPKPRRPRRKLPPPPQPVQHVWPFMRTGKAVRPRGRRSVHPDKKLSKRELGSLIYLAPGWDEDRPKERVQCGNLERPCAYASCKYHLGFEVNEYGTIRPNFSGVLEGDFGGMRETCALDVAERHQDIEGGFAGLLALHTAITGKASSAGSDYAGGASLQEVADILGLTIERVRQIEAAALEKCRATWRRIEAAEDMRPDFVPASRLARR